MADELGKDTDLRRQAEERTRAKSAGDSLPAANEEAQKLVHELEVHQVELERQNEELRETRRCLEESLAKYTDLYDFAPIGYLSFKRDGGITEANLAIATLLDTVRSKLVGRRFAIFIAPEARATFNAFLEIAFASHKTETWEGPLLGERSPPPFVRIEALFNNSGQECRAAIIDLSLRRQLQQELAQAHAELFKHTTELARHAAELKAMNRQLEAFTYTVSHELKTPLVTILGFVGQLQQDLKRKDQAHIQTDFNFISAAAHEMRAMLDDLLRLSRSGRAIIDPVPLDLSSLVQRAVSVLGGQLAHVDLQINLPAELPVVYGDPVRLHHVFQNLLGNAARFTREADEPRIEVGCTSGDGVLTCFVRDNGIGIASQYRERIFKIFEQLNPSEEGTGIGLAIVRRIAEEHGGQVWVQSAGEGHGSTFFFTLPTGLPCLSNSPEMEK